MSGYGDVKRRKIINVLKWLKNSKGVEVDSGSRHTLIKTIETQDKFPVPTAHPTVNKHIVKDLAEFLVKNKICTKKEFDKRIK